jgi:hypothetical protein
MWLPNDRAAQSIIDSGQGLLCNWWRNQKNGTIRVGEIRSKLTGQNADLHVNHFTRPVPGDGRSFSELTPFISLSAGTVERDALARTNLVHRARRTALWFGTDFGRHDVAYLYLCWVILAPRRAVEIEAVAEEVRDLNTYRRYSEYQTEGEILAKVHVPDNQIMCCEKWRWDRHAKRFQRNDGWTRRNPRFSPPTTLSNIREVI